MENNVDINQKAIVDVIQNLMSNLNNESNNKYYTIAETFLSNLSDKAKKSLNDPEDFYFITSYEYQQMLETLIKQVYPNLSEDVFYKICFLYKHYSFIEHQVTSLIKILDGWICSHDKVSWIIKNYLNYILTGNIKEKSMEYKYWEPEKGSMEDWMDFCDSIRHLYYGKMNMFLPHYKKLIEKKKG